MSSPKHELLRRIPAVETLLRDERLVQCAAAAPRKVVLDCLRQAVDEARAALREAPPDGLPSQAAVYEAIVARAEQAIRAAGRPYYCRVINATGIILHTALGRAALPRPAIRQIAEELAGYSLLQADPDSGRRSRRDARIEQLLRQLTAVEAATVVNNNAAATWLALNTLAAGKEVLVSRGQLVEIGGSFRLPEVMAASGAKMIEVGTTNKTHARDYQRAISEQTAAILRVHPSNYRITGFTSEVALEELARIAHARGLLLIDDVAAGALVDLSRFALDVGPTLAGSLGGGADIVLASTDKLIGAAQGGLILGKAALVEAVRSNPLARLVRVGKLTLAALEATLGLFLDQEQALAEVPTLRMVGRGLAEIAEQAQRIAAAIARAMGTVPFSSDENRDSPHAQAAGGGPPASVALVEGVSQMGGGSLPGQDLPTRLVAIRPAGMGPDELAARLRRHRPPVFTRISRDRVLIDPRTLLEGDEQPLVDAVVEELGVRSQKSEVRSQESGVRSQK